MGCCKSSYDSNGRGQLIKSLKHVIKQNQTRKLKFLLNIRLYPENSTIDIDNFLLPCDNALFLTIPGYAILCNSLEVFKYLHKHYRLSVFTLEEQLNKYDLVPLSILCSKGFGEFLEYYLTLAPSRAPLPFQSPEFWTISLSDSLKFSHFQYTPIQQACLNSHINCVQVIQNFYLDSSPPWWLDLNFQEHYTGENCAFLACKTGNFPMIKYLFVHTEADFHLKNARNENVLQVFLVGCKERKVGDQLQIFKFLVEEVGIDFRFQIDETLIICECEVILGYLRGKVEEKGVEVCVEDTEEWDDGLGRSQEKCQLDWIQRSGPSTIADFPEAEEFFFSFPHSPA